ncbi:hypothetical protein PHYPSEUDO_006482 [Phytophthora pseudosyringae]|uniref:Uncharacterized protein n=1 Tax=Phytophthora pseudosyringae TaxID=221518 RepID=A0A8T1VJJ0_9STRA|nr:hypothetical protein PHYPSEUDO_006482 [Phytophthora pseudosyringae]
MERQDCERTREADVDAYTAGRGAQPMGEQLLRRITLHALSVYNPVSAGLTSPHVQCIRAGQVDLHHVPAATLLKGVLLVWWQSAGIRLRDYVEAIFFLTLPEMPKEMRPVMTGRDW